MNNPFLKRLIKEKKDEVVHSSAYAEAQNAGNIGSASMQSFQERRTIDQNRKMVNKYRDSKIVNEFGRNSWRAKQEAAQFGGSADSDNKASVNGTNGLRGSLNATQDTKGSEKSGNSVPMRGPAQAPARKNPGISR